MDAAATGVPPHAMADGGPDGWGSGPEDGPDPEPAPAPAPARGDRKDIGGPYRVGEHPLKVTINRYLAAACASLLGDVSDARGALDGAALPRCRCSLVGFGSATTYLPADCSTRLPQTTCRGRAVTVSESAGSGKGKVVFGNLA